MFDNFKDYVAVLVGEVAEKSKTDGMIGKESYTADEFCDYQCVMANLGVLVSLQEPISEAIESVKEFLKDGEE